MGIFVRANLLIATTLLGLAVLTGCRTTSPEVPAWAFGMTLGESIDKNSVQPMDALIAGRALYRVRPPNPSRAMTQYAIVAGKESGVILGVVGWDRYSNNEACERERGGLAKTLEHRYGAGRRVEPADRERMRGLPESLGAGELTQYPGWDGVAVIGCAGPHLLIAYWWNQPPERDKPTEPRDAGRAP